MYQLAKLQMFDFYFLDRFLDRSDFELITDSNYLAISGEQLEDIVKPELRAELEAEKSSGWRGTSGETPSRDFSKDPGRCG